MCFASVENSLVFVWVNTTFRPDLDHCRLSSGFRWVQDPLSTVVTVPLKQKLYHNLDCIPHYLARGNCKIPHTRVLGSGAANGDIVLPHAHVQDSSCWNMHDYSRVHAHTHTRPPKMDAPCFAVCFSFLVQHTHTQTHANTRFVKHRWPNYENKSTLMHTQTHTPFACMSSLL